MTNLLWPGDERAGEHMSDPALLRAMVAVESAWLGATGLVPVEDADLANLLGERDCEQLAAMAEGGGNPVIGLVELLRRRAAPAIRPGIHRGLTSQDVVDTALMLALRGVLNHVAAQLAQQISTLSALAEKHRASPMIARTLTQHAAPTTFGAKAAGWLDGVVDAYERIGTVTTPAQFGGPVGTYPAIEFAEDVARSAATTLGLDFRTPWHTNRAPLTTAADALVGCTDSWGRIASDVVTLARPEVAELSEPAEAGRGGSSSMPHKHNPVLSILIRRAAIAAPPLAATLHMAAALANDERPDGAWHVEWDTMRTLARRSVVAGSQCSELLAGLQVHTAQLAGNLEAADVPGELHRGGVDRVIDEIVQRARRVQQLSR